MKVKVKGLVFVGFAAAILSANAMAADGDAKIVTSKLYVDNTFQKSADRVESAPAAGHADWSSTTKYPSMAVLSASQAEATNVVGDDTYTKVTDVAATSTTPAGKKVELQQTPASASTEITGTLDSTTEKKLVTTKAVKALIDTDAISSSSTDAKVATPKKVYTYAQPKVSNTAGALQVGYRGTSGDATWKTLKTAAATGTAAATTNYVTMTESSGVYTVNLASGQIDTAGTGISGGSTSNAKLATSGAVKALFDTSISSSSTDAKLPTSKAVYNFVTTNGSATYQPKVANDNHSTLMVGYNTRSGSEGSYTYSSNWKKLENAATADQASTDYVSIKADSNGVYQINIPSAQVGTAASDVTSSGTKLATGKAVYEYAQPRVASNSPQVGIRTGAGTDASPYAYTWNTLQAQSGHTGTASGTKYVTMTNSSGVYSIGLSSDQVAADYSASNVSSSSTKLVTGKALYNTILRESTGGTTTITGSNLTDNAKVPTVRNVVDYVDGQITAINPSSLVIPTPTGECASTNMTDSNDTACALVLAYWPVDTTNGISTAGVQLKWVKMAQAQ